MYIPEDLKVNKFTMVRIPKRKDYLARHGNITASKIDYTGEDIPPMNGNKLDNIAYYDQYDKMMQEEELKNSK